MELFLCSSDVCVYWDFATSRGILGGMEGEMVISPTLGEAANNSLVESKQTEPCLQGGAFR